VASYSPNIRNDVSRNVCEYLILLLLLLLLLLIIIIIIIQWTFKDQVFGAWTGRHIHRTEFKIGST